jgi:small subunit ribosomal protein S21
VILVNVHAGNGEQAIKNLKRKMQRELVFRSMKMSRFYEPPSVKRVRKDQETERRKRKVARKQMMEG